MTEEISYKRVTPPSKSDRETYSGLVPYGCSCDGRRSSDSSTYDNWVLIGTPTSGYVTTSSAATQAVMSTQCVVNMRDNYLVIQGVGFKYEVILAVCRFGEFPSDADSTYLYHTTVYLKEEGVVKVDLPDFEALVVPSGMNVMFRVIETVVDSGGHGTINWHFFSAVDPD